MTEEIKLYCIQEQGTTGEWYLIDSSANNLNQSVCAEMYEMFLNKGHNPNYMRIVRVK